MKKTGTGIATFFYPAGLPGGGDPSQAMIKMRNDGSAHLTIGSVDIGQGCKTVLAQIAAEALGIEYEWVTVENDDTDRIPFCMGTFGSRVTYITGNAIIEAAKEVKKILFPMAAQLLEAPEETLTAQGGQIFVKEQHEISISIAEVCQALTFGMGVPVIGRGGFLKHKAEPDPDTGALDVTNTMCYGAVQAEVEVDTETGVVDVKKLVCIYDVGKVVNPLLAEGQIEGGAAMGMGAALMENLAPNYPDVEGQPTSLDEYIIPTTEDMPEIVTGFVEQPSANGPFGAKGLGEVTANIHSPAIGSAVYDALGIWINEIPLTPSRVLRAIKAQEAR